MALTERQQEIKALQDQGKTPREIAEALGITVNGIYQQLRRMKAGGAKPSTAKKPAAKPAIKASPAKAPPVPPAHSLPPREMTPLQAIRARKSAIEAQLKQVAADVQTAAHALEKAGERQTTMAAKHSEELRQLEVAEGVITGQVPLKNAPKPPAKPSGKNGKSALASVPPAAPVDPPAAAVPAEPAAEPAAPVADPATA